ncbi:MAG: trypsin-like peptidase domain-containing protein [Nitriliruptorales bacterium]|nr:trypsin-like peptidase domain-containing protein [Nitriliruptorales bacterium]
MVILVGGLSGALVAFLVSAGLWLVRGDRGGIPETPPEGTAAPAETPLDVHAVLEQVGRSVVAVETGRSDLRGLFGSAGTGVVVSAEEGMIVTNAHVVEDADTISVTFLDGSQQVAHVVGVLPLDDLALLQVSRTEGLVAAELGDSSSLEVGDPVVAIGNALGLGNKPTVTAGIVSAIGRDIDVPGIHLRDLIQTDAAVNHGNSGGPLVNADGQVVGINTVVAEGAENIGFAIPIDTFREQYARLGGR